MSNGELCRELRLLDAVAIGLGAIIGAGLFVVSGVAAGLAGPAFLIGLLLAGLAATCNALSSAQLAAAYPQSGGTYEYANRVLNPWLGFAAGWMFLASKLAAGGTVALGFAEYLARFFPQLPVRPVAITAVLLLTVVNYFGIKKAGRLNTVIVSFTLLALLYFIASGVSHFDSSKLEPFAPNGIRGVLESAAILFFAYTGYARLATLGEEVHDPVRTIPRAIVISLSIAMVLYAAVMLVAVGAIGAPAMAATRAPIETAAKTFAWPGVAQVVMIGATTAMLGVLLSQILGISRMMLAMARRRDLPRALDHVHAENAVPDRGVWITGAIIALVSFFGTLEWIVSAAAFTILLYYAITNIAALKMPADKKLFPDWVSILGLLMCFVLALSLKVETILSGLALLIVGLILRAVFRKRDIPAS